MTYRLDEEVQKGAAIITALMGIGYVFTTVKDEAIPSGSSKSLGIALNM